MRLLSSLALEWHDVAAGFHAVELISPPLHRLRSLRQILGSVVNPAHVAALVRKLHFDPVAVEALLVQQRRCGLAKAVRC